MTQLMASMSSVGGGDSLQDIWAMMESGFSPRIATPRHHHADSMCVVCDVCSALSNSQEVDCEERL